MNLPIQEIKVKVDGKYLYDGEEGHGFFNGKVIGVSSYIGQPLTFHVIIENSYLYSDLPVCAFNKYEEKSRDLSTLAYSNCSTLPIDVFRLSFKEVCVYFRNLDRFEHGVYHMSFDFYEGNDLIHLIELDSGEFCLMPNHKVNFNNQEKLPDYKKNHTVWEVKNIT